MQVEPIKPTLKAPGTERLKLKYDELHSSVAFNFNLRRYSMVITEYNTSAASLLAGAHRLAVGLKLMSFMVGRCTLTL